MTEFKLPSIPPSSNKSIRFPNPVIEQIENEIAGKNCSFTAFVVEATRVALTNLEEQRKKDAENNSDSSPCGVSAPLSSSE